MNAATMSEKICALGQQKILFDDLPCFPKEIAYLLTTSWGDIRIFRHLLEISEICRVLYDCPASFEMLEMVYFGKPVRPGVMSNGIDDWLSNSLSGQALRDRLEVISDFMSKIIRVRLTNGRKKMRVLDLGSGPGPYAFKSIDKAGVSTSGLLWECLDLSRFALKIGEIRAMDSGLEDVVTFCEADFLSRASYPIVDENRFDFGLMIGILCGMTPEQAVTCLNKIVPFFRPCAELVVATLLEKSFEEDERVFRVLCNTLGWQLQPKSLDDVRSIFKVAGYEIKRIFSERRGGNGQYAIVHAVVPG